MSELALLSIVRVWTVSIMQYADPTFYKPAWRSVSLVGRFKVTESWIITVYTLLNMLNIQLLLNLSHHSHFQVSCCTTKDTIFYRIWANWKMTGFSSKTYYPHKTV